jgi:hypothetical protein
VHTLLHFNKFLFIFNFVTFPSSNTLFPSLEKENLATNLENKSNEPANFYRFEQAWLSSKINIWKQSPTKTLVKKKKSSAKFKFKT